MITEHFAQALPARITSFHAVPTSRSCSRGLGDCAPLGCSLWVSLDGPPSHRGTSTHVLDGERDGYHPALLAQFQPVLHQSPSVITEFPDTSAGSSGTHPATSRWPSKPTIGIPSSKMEAWWTPARGSSEQPSVNGSGPGNSWMRPWLRPALRFRNRPSPPRARPAAWRNSTRGCSSSGPHHEPPPGDHFSWQAAC